MKNLALFILVLWVLPYEAAVGRAPLTNHPLISPYEDSKIRRKSVKEFEEYSAFMGMDSSGKKATGIELEGKITKILYNMPKNRSILEVYRNYEMTLKQSDAEILYACNQAKSECAKRYAGPTLQKFSDIHSISNLKGRYMLAKMDVNKKTAYIAIAVGQTFTDIHILEVKKMDQGMVSLNAEALGRGIDSKGFVVIEGIYFDTDKSILKHESNSALMEMAKLIKSRPKMTAYIVGHTDNKGSLSHNQKLSKNRAEAVVKALVQDHKIPQSRLTGYGVGPLAPKASNKSESGRSQNRRVVMVTR